MVNTLLRALSALLPVRRPTRSRKVYRFRLVAASSASLLSAVTFLIVYYLTLGLVPSTDLQLGGYHPFPYSADHLDLAQFFGTIIDPPYVTHFSWLLGLIGVAILLMAAGLAFAVLNSWFLHVPTPAAGAAFGGLTFIVLSSIVSLGSGFNPGVMRQALPDVGFFLLGWSIWATAQLLACSVIYGYSLGLLYRQLGFGGRSR